MRPAVYRGDLGELLAKYMGRHAGRDQECAALVQTVTNVGHTSRWQPGPRVVDQNYIEPGTVIANFVTENGQSRYPNRSSWHVAIFLDFGPRYVNGGYANIWVLDQWRGSSGVARRSKKAFSREEVRRNNVRASNNANEYYIVLVP